MVSSIILTKRKKITLTGGISGAQTDYQVKLDVTYDSDMNVDFSDLRFTESDGKTLLDSWLESKVDSTSAVIYVKTNTPANGHTTDIYMYYCNSTLGANWNGTDIFTFFDDGELHNDSDSLTTGGWANTGGGTFEYDSSKAYDGSISLYMRDADNWAKQNFTPEADGSGILEFAFYDNGGTYSMGGVYDQSETESCFIGYYNSNSTTKYLVSYGTGYISLATVADRSVGWHQGRITVKPDGSMTFAIDGIESVTTAPAGEMDDFGRIGLRDYGSSDSWFDRVRVRKYVANPATVVFGSEETSSLYLRWAKKKKITLTGQSSGAQTDYPLMFNVVYDSDMKSDFSDLRFTTLGGTLLDSWLETKIDSTSAVIWVKTDTPADTVDVDIYMYYGNAGASSDWQASTFTFIDEFNRADSPTVGNGWAETGNSCITSNALTVSGTGVVSTVSRNFAFSGGSYAADMKFKSPSLAKLCYLIISDGSHTSYLTVGQSSAEVDRIQSYLPTNTLLDPYSINTNYVLTNARVDGSNFDYSLDYGNTGASFSNQTPTSVTTDDNIKIYAGYDTAFVIDWVKIRKYVQNPATYVFGAEESTDIELDLQVWYTIGELVGKNIQVPYNVLRLVPPQNLQTEVDVASSDRLQLLQIQVHTESTNDVTLDFQTKFNIKGYVLSDLQRVWSIGNVGLSVGQLYNILNLTPPIDNQVSYCIKKYVHDDIVRSYNIRFPGGYYCKPALGINTGIHSQWIIEDLDRKYHNWKVWETKYDFRWKAELYNTETVEGRAIMASVQGDYIRLLTETLEVFYKAENVFYTDGCTSGGFDMDGTYPGYEFIDGLGWYTGQLPKGSHEESDVGHKLRLDIIADYPLYFPHFSPGDAETGWTYIFNRNGYLRTHGDESSCGHGFYKIDLLIAGNLDTGLDFEILIDGEVEHTIENLVSRGLGWISRPIIACRSPNCWHCCDDHTHWVVWSWESNYVCTKLEYHLTNIDGEYGRKRASYTVWGTTDSWTGDPETMTWTNLGSSSISGTFDSTADELKRVMDIQPMDGCTYILADIRTRYTWLDEDNVFQKSYCLDTTVSEPNFFKMQRITLSNVPCLDEAKFRVIASQIYLHTHTKWIELAHIFITRYKDMGYCQQNVWTHFPALYEWKYLELLRVLSHESTNAYMKLKLWKPTVETDWFGEYGISDATFYKSSDITPPSGYESAEWLRWKVWLTSTGAYTPEFHWTSVHSECHDVPMGEIDFLQGTTWDAEEAAGTMFAGGIDIDSSRLKWCYDINIKASQPAGSIYVDIDEAISTGTPYAGTLVVTDAQYPNVPTFEDVIKYSSQEGDRFTLPYQWYVKADQNAGQSYVDVFNGENKKFYIKEDQLAGETYIDIDEGIPSDAPLTGLIIVKDSVTDDEIELEYSSWSGYRFILENTSYNIKANQLAGVIYVDVDAPINLDTPSEGSLIVNGDVMEYTSYLDDRFTVAATPNIYNTTHVVTAAVTPEDYQTLDTVRFARDCMEITLPQTGYINVDGDPMAYTSWEKDRFTVSSTPSSYDAGDGVGIGTPRAYTTAHYVEPQCNTILRDGDLAGKWMQLNISGVSTEQVDALVRPAVWLRPNWISIEIPLDISWSESVVGKVWSGYCIDQNSDHITSAEGGYLTLIAKRGNTNLNIVNTSCMVDTDGFFQVFMKGDYEDWEFTMQRLTSDRIFDPGYRQYPSGSNVEFEDVVGSYDLKFWVVAPEDICPKSIAHLDSLATY